MAVLVLPHTPTGTPAAVRHPLAAAGLSLIDGPEPPADLRGVTGVIVLDGPAAAAAEDDRAAAALTLVREALAAEVPLLALGAAAHRLVATAGRATAGTAAAPVDGQDPGVDTHGLLTRFAATVAARAEHTTTRAFFTRRADSWEERFAHQTPAYEAAVARMRLAPGARAVDLGCGTGRAMPALRARTGPGGQVLGIDVTPAMLTAAARHGRSRHGHLIAADCTRLPLPRGGVDGIFSAGLVDHLPDPGAALREWARISAPAGVLLLFHPSGRAERAARHGRPLDAADLLAEPNLRPALAAAGWHLDEYEDAPHHTLARALRR
ncbi:methyltransferase domain-containing protein [Streptomyces sp. NPDC089919]|uniref:class I SAM-dependent methyltransferase n=1 Tax=Streptomyces sp. NPDC089919 TaxID=3155188 RepID=UPI003418DD07